MAELMKVENLKNGMILGALAGALLLWGDKIKQPILDLINKTIPINYQFGGITAILIVIGVGVLIGLIVDKT